MYLEGKIKNLNLHENLYLLVQKSNYYFFKCGRRQKDGNYLIPNTQNSLFLTLSLSIPIFSFYFTLRKESKYLLQAKTEKLQPQCGMESEVSQGNSTRSKLNPKAKSQVKLLRYCGEGNQNLSQMSLETNLFSDPYFYFTLQNYYIQNCQGIIHTIYSNSSIYEQVSFRKNICKSKMFASLTK